MMNKVLNGTPVSGKVVTVLITVSIILCMIYALIVYYTFARLRPFSHNNIPIKNDEILCYVDANEKDEDGSNIIIGWAFYNNKLRIVNNHVVLEDIQTGNKYLAYTQMVKRDDVNNLYPGAMNSGYFARIIEHKLNQSHDYKIYIFYQSDGESFLIDTNTYINKG